MKQEKKKHGFIKGFLVYILLMIALIVTGWVVLWRYLEHYEAARPVVVMENYMTQSLETDVDTAITVYAVERETYYQSASEIAEYLRGELAGLEWNYEKDEELSTEENPVFVLRCDEVALGHVTLTHTEDEAQMGIEQWENPAAQFDFDPLGKAVSVIAPYECTVLVDGVQLDDEFVTEALGLYPQLEEYELLITDPCHLLVYTLEPVFTEGAVEFSEGYTVLSCDEEDVHYAVPEFDGEEAEQLLTYCESFVQAYVDFTANNNGLWNVQQYMVENCDLFDEMTQATVGLNWGHGVNAEITMLEIKDFVYYGNAITCNAVYSMTRDDGDRTDHMHILLVNTEDGWRVIHREMYE